MNKRDRDIVRKNIDGNIYKLIRLCKIEGNEVIPVIPFNRFAPNSASERLTYILNKIDSRTLPPGKYQVQCRMSNTNQTMTDKYDFEVKETMPLPSNPVEDKTSEQETISDMGNISIDDYIDLIREKEKLAAMNAVLSTERDFYKAEFDKLKALGGGSTEMALKDNGTMHPALKVLEDTAPALINLGDRLFDYLEKKNNLEEKKLEKGVVKTKKSMAKNQSLEDRAIDLADEIEQLSEEEQEERLDLLEAENPELYEMVCEELGIDFEEEEEEEEGEEGDHAE